MNDSVSYLGLLGRNSWEEDFLSLPSNLPYSFVFRFLTHNLIKRCGQKAPFNVNLFTLECFTYIFTPRVFPLPLYQEPHGCGSVLQLLEVIKVQPCKLFWYFKQRRKIPGLSLDQQCDNLYSPSFITTNARPSEDSYQTHWRQFYSEGQPDD